MMPQPQAADREVTELVETLTKQLEHDYTPPFVKRDAHPKMHGCVQAEFRIDDDVPDDLQHGVFARPGKTYLAWIRFSNAVGIQHDLEAATRGMAVKLLDVEGEHIPGESEGATQDFLISTHDAFIVPNFHGYVHLVKAGSGGPLKIFQFFWERRLWRGFWALLKSGFVLARNPLAIPYFSQTAYKLGPGLTVKHQVRPVLTPELRAALPRRWWFRIKMLVANVALTLLELPSMKPFLGFFGLPGTKASAEDFCGLYIAPFDLLRLAMMSFLAEHDAWFDVLVQTQSDPQAMPDDDPTVSWDQQLSPFRKVARIRIPRQVFWPEIGMPRDTLAATKRMVDLGENMSFSPWHGLTDHRPLGAINEARRTIYREMSDFRRGQNRVPRRAPTTAEYRKLQPFIQCGFTDPKSEDRPEGEA